jgi:3-deoxy-D-arabino-heptulosonate 7-phosphate (DAHP) synthase class II
MKVAARNGWSVYSAPFTNVRRQLFFFNDQTDEAYTLWIAVRTRKQSEVHDSITLEQYETPVWLKAGDEMWSDPPAHVTEMFHEEISGFLVHQRLTGAWRYGSIEPEKHYDFPTVPSR